MQQYTLIIPCYNEPPEVLSKTVTKLDECFQQMEEGIDYEIIVVNDGSTDYTYPDFTAKHIQILQHNENQGYGASLITGIQQAQYDWIGIIDADSTYPVDQFPKLLHYTDEYDMVIGERKLKDVEWIRRFPKYLMYKVASFLSDYSIPDLNSGMRLFKKSIVFKYIKLFPRKFSFTTTITMICVTNFYHIKFVPISYYRRSGQSKIHPIKDTIRFFTLIMKISLYFKPLRFFIPLSLLFLVLAVLRGIRDVLVVNHLGGVALVLFFLSLQTFFFGLIAEIISKKV